MVKLEELTRGSIINGILPNQSVTVIEAKWHGTDVVELTYKDASGQPYTELLFRDREPTLEIVTVGKPWSFDGDGDTLRLVSEAHRIRLAYLFDPLLAVHTSLVEPLPHQITAVYGEMLNRQPLRFLLADDPGAGKTIMAGLLIRELLIRGDLARCLIVCPGSLAVQWQDELHNKFHLPFDILTNDRIEAARTGNAFAEMGLVIARLDKLSRNDDLQEKLQQTDWDLVICDEAHKMSASFFGGEIRETRRYKLGKLLSSITRHFLLMTATPHNGKEEDFQLFLALLDGDRLPDKPLFCTVDRATFGHRLSGNAIYNIVRNSSESAGITKVMSPHRIRHSAITAALDATNGDTRKVQKLSRHRNLNTLMIYDDNRHQHQSEVTNILADLV